ncbi:uncharacterized protein [Nicotiana tomentosiformis]|uniref:uncharacterized protein n=1 Tax=Nicotiana tomentosiformis TaxID=4098 RepID=UPI00388C5538
MLTLRSGQVVKEPTHIQKVVVPKKESGEQLKNEVDKKKKGKKRTEKKKKGENSRRDESEERKHMSALPFPQKLYRGKLDKQYERFLDMLRQEILTKKRKINETSIVKLTERCSEILQNKLSQKCGDLGKLESEIGEIRSVPIFLQLANQTTLIPEEIVDDVLVWVDKFVFPVDFIVVNMEVPLILGRPLLVTGRAILDIHDRKLMLRVSEEMVTFEMSIENGVRKEKPATSVEWKVKNLNENAPVIGKDKRGVYPKKVAVCMDVRISSGAWNGA